MRGSAVAKQYVTDFLEESLEGYLNTLRTEWGLDSSRLPSPVAFFPHEPHLLDRWPMVATSAVRMARLTLQEQTRLGSTYTMRYSLRTFVWVSQRGFGDAIEARDSLTTAIRIALLDMPWLGLLDQRALMEETTLTEEYSDVTAVKGDRYVAGSYLGFDLLVEEELDRTARGTVNSTQVEAVPAHPALD